ncbi:MAG: hypothetical protein JW943_04690 [Deltaproteobacteria bacterium]|nr:hypothetical protein [Deltaproteobacteria bacterium]
MKMMSPEKCAELIDRHQKDVFRCTSKLHLILEYFEEIASGIDEREFRSLPMLASGIVHICDEIIHDLEECDYYRIAADIRLFSPDIVKVAKRVECYRSMGITNETIKIEIEDDLAGQETAAAKAI